MKPAFYLIYVSKSKRAATRKKAVAQQDLLTKAVILGSRSQDNMMGRAAGVKNIIKKQMLSS